MSTIWTGKLIFGAFSAISIFATIHHESKSTVMFKVRPDLIEGILFIATNFFQFIVCQPIQYYNF